MNTTNSRTSKNVISSLVSVLFCMKYMAFYDMAISCGSTWTHISKYLKYTGTMLSIHSDLEWSREEEKNEKLADTNRVEFIFLSSNIQWACFSLLHFGNIYFFFIIRFLSTLNYSVPLATNATAVSKDESREFMSVFPGK